MDSVRSTADDAVTLAASGRKPEALPPFSLALEAIADVDGSEGPSLSSGLVLRAALLYRLYEIDAHELASSADSEIREQSRYLLTVLDAAGNRENLLAKSVETLRGLDADLAALAQPPYDAPLWARTDCLLAMTEHARLLAARPDSFFQKYTSPQFPAAFAIGRIRTVLAGVTVNFAAAAVRSAVEAAAAGSTAGEESLNIARNAYRTALEDARRMQPGHSTPPPPARPETITHVMALAVRQPAGSGSADPGSPDCIEPCAAFLNLESGPHQVRGRSALDWA
ncbi:MAG: hypothetical protein RDV41_05380, partial [Planctomycetota bacterium]|nr:hypothetical protein [Planctomycetota bacterium]